MKLRLAIFSSLILCLANMFCSAFGATQRLTIAVVPMATTDEYWKAIHAGAMKAAKEFDVDILWKGPLRLDDRNSQVDIVENMIVRQVAGVVLAPIDDTSMRGAVENCVRSGIPVVIIDSALKSGSRISFIATDNHKGGEVAGDYLARLLNYKGRVAMLRTIEGNSSGNNRERGFLDSMKKFHNIKVVSSNQHSGGTIEEAYKASENLLSPLKGQDGKLNLDGMFCPNESTTFAMLRALEDSGMAGKVKFVGFDTSTKLNAALYSGKINGLIVQNPMKMSYLAVKAIVDYLNHKKVEEIVDTGVSLITTENAKTEAMHELLEPDTAKWLK